MVVCINDESGILKVFTMVGSRKSHGGAWCSAINCSNNSKQQDKRSFFRFPKNIEQSKMWVMLVRRADLDDKSAEYLYNNCRICSDHFEKVMFLNDLRNRLHAHAVPTIFNFPMPPPRLRCGRRHVRMSVGVQTTQDTNKKKHKVDSSITTVAEISADMAAEILLRMSESLPRRFMNVAKK